MPARKRERFLAKKRSIPTHHTQLRQPWRAHLQRRLISPNESCLPDKDCASSYKQCLASVNCAFSKVMKIVAQQRLGTSKKSGYARAGLPYPLRKPAWMVSQIPAGAEGLDQLVCEGKALRGSAVETEDGNHRDGPRPTASLSPSRQPLATAPK
jgi:hypothetical protein